MILPATVEEETAMRYMILLAAFVLYSAGAGLVYSTGHCKHPHSTSVAHEDAAHDCYLSGHKI